MKYAIWSDDDQFGGWGNELIVHYGNRVRLDESGSFELGFGSTLNRELSDESWGVDNILIRSTE